VQAFVKGLPHPHPEEPTEGLEGCMPNNDSRRIRRDAVLRTAPPDEVEIFSHALRMRAFIFSDAHTARRNPGATSVALGVRLE
jgi:hypothetical protein